MSVAVGSVMENVKEKKIEAMKKIKKLQKDKERNHEKMKATKEMYGKTKKVSRVALAPPQSDRLKLPCLPSRLCPPAPVLPPRPIHPYLPPS